MALRLTRLFLRNTGLSLTSPLAQTNQVSCLCILSSSLRQNQSFHTGFSFHRKPCTWMQTKWLREYVSFNNHTLLLLEGHTSINKISSFSIPFSCTHRNFSTNQTEDTGKSSTADPEFAESEKCLLFGETGLLLNNVTTVGDASFLAQRKKMQLVYMQKNADGVHCFKLQAHTKKSAIEAAKSVGAAGGQARQKSAGANKGQSKQKQAAVKQYKFLSNVSDNDIDIKLKKIRAAVEKRKLDKVEIFITHIRSDAKDFKTTTSKFSKKLSEYLKDVCTIKQEHASERIYKYAAIPVDSLKKGTK